MKKIIEGQAQYIKAVSTQYPTGFGVGGKKKKQNRRTEFVHV